MAFGDKLKQLINDLRGSTPKTYTVLTIDLTNAAVNRLYGISGSYIYMIQASDTVANVDIRFNSEVSDAVNLIRSRGIRTPFWQFFLSWPAQAAKSVTLIIANEMDILQVQESPSIATLSNQITFAQAENYKQTAVGVAVVQIYAVLNTRRSLLIKNVGTTNLFLGWDNAVTVNNGFRLRPDEGAVLDRYTGTLFAIGDAAGGNIATMVTKEA